MQTGSKTPFSIVFCNAMIRAVAQLVPAAQRQEWKQEWQAEIWHRWQFFLYAGEWNRREALRLIRDCLGAFPDAAWHFASQDAVQNRIREWPRSPRVFLAGLTAGLLFLAAITSGLPATRGLLFSQSNDSSKLLFLWLHPVTGGGDKGLPPDAAPDWAAHSKLLAGVVGFNITRQRFYGPGIPTLTSLVIETQPELFQVLRVRQALGGIARVPGVVLNHQMWASRFHSDPKAIGRHVLLNGISYPIAAVLPADYRFLTRQPALYLIQKSVTGGRVMVVARAKPGVSEQKLRRELEKISENVSYYFFGSDLRMGFLETEMLAPLRFFGVAVLVSICLVLTVVRVRMRHVQLAWKAGNRRATALRVLFFVSKTILALAFVFIAGLEWSRSESSVLLASRDPATGPFILWLYVLGAMGVMFWSLADQRARCRVCLRLLCFPVRIGCPGCLLLDWSGTELACTQGHGVLHVPHLAPSWDEDTQHWISLDESWSELFAHTK